MNIMVCGRKFFSIGEREREKMFFPLFTGENVLHIAIVNEEPATVKFLLDAGVDFQQRCCGTFFCPADQKSSR